MSMSVMVNTSTEGKNNKKQNKNVPPTNEMDENPSININKRKTKIKEEKTLRIVTQNIQKGVEDKIKQIEDILKKLEIDS
jgi:hypothetical protein